MVQFTQAVAALKPGVSVAQAQAEIEALEKHLVQAGGREPPVTKVQVGLLQENSLAAHGGL